MANPFAARISPMFDDPAEDLAKREQDYRKKILTASRVGSPGKITTLLGYSGNTKEE